MLNISQRANALFDNAKLLTGAVTARGLLSFFGDFAAICAIAFGVALAGRLLWLWGCGALDVCAAGTAGGAPIASLANLEDPLVAQTLAGLLISGASWLACGSVRRVLRDRLSPPKPAADALHIFDDGEDSVALCGRKRFVDTKASLSGYRHMADMGLLGILPPVCLLCADAASARECAPPRKAG